uniref:Uncharacterized protein n=1 Tax=Setaria italica TaxID=4555 RepID=K4AHQ4_SETIT
MVDVVQFYTYHPHYTCCLRTGMLYRNNTKKSCSDRITHAGKLLIQDRRPFDNTYNTGPGQTMFTIT